MHLPGSAGEGLTTELAVANNHAWYMTMFRAHGLASRIEEHYWSTDEEPLPYHSHLVTRTRGRAASEAQLGRLAQLAARPGRRGPGCKDSFDELPRLELERLGLRELFQAWWYGWAPDSGLLEAESGLKARPVQSPEALWAWEEQWRQSSPAGEVRSFPQGVLADSELELLTMELNGAAAGGFALNRSDGAVGLSNVFQLSGSGCQPGVFVRECARAARRLHVDLPLVGYGPESELEELQSLGFACLGALRVWVA